MVARRAAAGDLPEKWHHVEAAMAEDFADNRGGCWRSGRARVGLINRAADLAISPVSDEMQWGGSLERSV
jgi:hypothetical protein